MYEQKESASKQRETKYMELQRKKHIFFFSKSRRGIKVQVEEAEEDSEEENVNRAEEEKSHKNGTKKNKKR